jgi:RIO kinase 1
LPRRHDRIFDTIDREEALDARRHSGHGDERKVFDERTLKALHKLMNEGLFQIIDFPIATGKEASVFVAVGKKGDEFAVKIYRVANATFNSIRRYIEDDPRFRLVGHDKRSVIYTWAMKEYKNLMRMHRAGVRVPRALRYYENILVMEYLSVGENHDPAPPLRGAKGYDPEAVFEHLKQDVRKIVEKARLVHGDVSEYNVLMVEDTPYIIDASQGVMLEHPASREYLMRDATNLAKFFRRKGVEADADELYAFWTDGVDFEKKPSAGREEEE